MTEKDKWKSCQQYQSVGLDFGSSGIKEIDWSGLDSKVNSMYVSSEYLKLPGDRALQLPSSQGTGRPEDTAWVRYSRDGECHLIGLTATDYMARFNYREAKFESIVPKTLAIIGALVEKRGLDNQLVINNLGLMLPWNERVMSAQIGSLLKQKLRSFYFRSRRLQVRVNNLVIAFESMGVALLEMKRNQLSSMKKMAYLMMGANHLTFAPFTRGKLVESECVVSKFGFVYLIDLMLKRVAALEREEVMQAFSTRLNSGILTTQINWAKIRRGSITNSFLESAYQESLIEYFSLVANYLNGCNLSGVESVVRAGGTSELIAQPLKDFLAKKDISLYVPLDYSDRLLKALGFEDLKSPEAQEFIKLNPMRYADLWGLFVAISGYEEQQLQHQSSILTA